MTMTIGRGARKVRRQALKGLKPGPLFALAGLMAFGLGLAGCGSSPKATTLQCVLNSDCSGSLVCAQGYCVSACVTSRDCAGNSRCIILPDLGNVCQPLEKQTCAYNSQCAPLVCGVDLECRNQCRTDVDCPGGQKCTTTSKLCVDPIRDSSHYDPATNELIPAPDAGARDAGSSGKAGAGGTGGSAGASGSAGAAGASGAAGKGGAPMGGHGGTGGAAGGGGVAGAGGAPSCFKPGNNALHFAGGQWVTIPDAASLHLTDFTIEAWVSFPFQEPASTAAVQLGAQVIIAKPNGSGIGDSFEIDYYAGSLYAGVAIVDGTSPFLQFGWVPAQGRWYHVALTYDHAAPGPNGGQFGALSLYIDGAKVVTGDAPGFPTYDTHPIYVGADSDSGSMAWPLFGDVDEVTIWPTARTSAEIQSDLKTCAPSSYTGMTGYWTLDEGTGQTVADKSPNNNPGYLGSLTGADSADPTWIFSTVPWGGDYTLPAAGVSATSQCSKPRNKALHLGGAITYQSVQKKYATVADKGSLHLPSFTMEAWVNYAIGPGAVAGGNTVTGTSVIFQYYGGQATTGSLPGSSFVLYHPDATHLSCGGAWGSLSAPFTPVPGRWYHIACSYNAASGEIDLDVANTLGLSGAATSTPQYDTGPFVVGGGFTNGNANFTFFGDIDEVMIWNSARTAEQITTDLHTCTPASLDGLAAYWSFDEGTGQVATDATGNANNLQLGSAAGADSADPDWVVSTVPF